MLSNRCLPGSFSSSWLTTLLSSSLITFKSNWRHNRQSSSQCLYYTLVYVSTCWVKTGGGKIISSFSLWMRRCIINHKTCFPLQVFLILKNSAAGASSVQTQMYKVLQNIRALLWHIYLYVPNWKSCWSWIFEGMIFFWFPNKRMFEFMVTWRITTDENQHSFYASFIGNSSFLMDRRLFDGSTLKRMKINYRQNFYYMRAYQQLGQ